MKDLPRNEIERIAFYLKGMADAQQNETLHKAHEWMLKLSKNVCSQGVIGHYGDECTSDHK